MKKSTTSPKAQKPCKQAYDESITDLNALYEGLHAADKAAKAEKLHIYKADETTLQEWRTFDALTRAKQAAKEEAAAIARQERINKALEKRAHAELNKARILIAWSTMDKEGLRAAKKRLFAQHRHNREKALGIAKTLAEAEALRYDAAIERHNAQLRDYNTLRWQAIQSLPYGEEREAAISRYYKAERDKALQRAEELEARFTQAMQNMALRTPEGREKATALTKKAALLAP